MRLYIVEGGVVSEFGTKGGDGSQGVSSALDFLVISTPMVI